MASEALDISRYRNFTIRREAIDLDSEREGGVFVCADAVNAPVSGALLVEVFQATVGGTRVSLQRIMSLVSGERYARVRSTSAGWSAWLSRVGATVFTTSGTYSLPSWANSFDILAFGGGGGGGAGRRASAGTGRSGGGGGGTGAWIVETFLREELSGGDLTISVGAGGAGAAGVLIDDTSGAADTAGSTTTVTDGSTVILRAAGGNGGAAGTPSVGIGDGGPGIVVIMAHA